MFEPFVDDLVRRTGFAVVFPEYTLAPEEQFPVQHEQWVDGIQHVVKHGKCLGLDTRKIVITSDSAGCKWSGGALTGSHNGAPLLLKNDFTKFSPSIFQVCLYLTARPTSDRCVDH